jgi:cbb3-type cytochrome oxidase cytochrome c subunit
MYLLLYMLQDVESDDEDLDDEDLDDGAEHEVEDAPAELAVKTVEALAAPPKDTERQLSKKELKKRELAELDAVLAELGLSGNSTSAAQDGKNHRCYH